MAGAGFKDFVAGDVLTADQVDQYLMQQCTMRFATTTARDTALSGTVAEGMVCYTDDTNSLWVYNGSAWIRTDTGWTSFTPSWPIITVGNGTNVGRYRYVAGDLHVKVHLTWGSTTSQSGGATRVTIPDSQTTAGMKSVGIWWAVGGGTYYDGSGNSAVGQTDFYFNNVTATAPFTWTTGDELIGDFVITLTTAV